MKCQNCQSSNIQILGHVGPTRFTPSGNVTGITAYGCNQCGQEHHVKLNSLQEMVVDVFDDEALTSAYWQQAGVKIEDMQRLGSAVTEINNLMFKLIGAAHDEFDIQHFRLACLALCLEHEIDASSIADADEISEWLEDED